MSQGHRNISQCRRAAQIRCQRDWGSVAPGKPSRALATPRLPSAFSNSIGLTLWGIVDEPTSPGTARWPEVPDAHVSPQVPAQVQHDGIDAQERMTIRGIPVVGFDLRRMAIVLQAQASMNCALIAARELRVGRQMGIEVTHRAIDLGEDPGLPRSPRPAPTGDVRNWPVPCPWSWAMRAGRGSGTASAHPQTGAPCFEGYRSTCRSR